MAGVRSVILKVGTVVILEKEGDETGDEFKSKVIDAGDGFVMIDYPAHVETGKTTFLPNDTALFATFTDDLKMSYGFQTTVKGRHHKGIPMLQLAYEGDENLIKVQRREFVRVDANLDVAVEVGDDVYRLVTADISAGGLAINLPTLQTLTAQTIVKLLIVLPFAAREIEYVRAKAEVVRVWEDHGRNIASLTFLDTSSSDRQQIVKFCFEHQLQMKKKMQ